MTDPNLSQINSIDQEGMTPLHHAIFHQREKFAMTLIKIGCDLNIKDVRGMTPLHLAVLNSSLIVIRSLLNAGANPYAVNLSNDTPLDLAKRHKKSEIISEFE